MASFRMRYLSKPRKESLIISKRINTSVQYSSNQVVFTVSQTPTTTVPQAPSTPSGGFFIAPPQEPEEEEEIVEIQEQPQEETLPEQTVTEPLQEVEAKSEETIEDNLNRIILLSSPKSKPPCHKSSSIFLHQATLASL